MVIDMAGDIFISATRKWMKAGWAFRSALESALCHIPDSMPKLRTLVAERCGGWNYLNLESECSAAEVRALLRALQEGYSDMETAGSSNFGDPSYYPSFMAAFAELVLMIEEELKSKEHGDSHRSETGSHGETGR
jgi:hypothetical protein